MPPKRSVREEPVLPPNDPRRPLLVQRLSSERGRIADFLSREPRLEDAEYQEWEASVGTLLTQLFDPGTYYTRFAQLRIRPISYSMLDGAAWFAEPREAWQTGLKMADKILGQALEEAGVEFRVTPAREPAPSRVPTVVITNVFSPTVHVTVSQLMTQLDDMGLSGAERQIAKEQIAELEAETKGQQRWGLIGRHLDSIKAMGKGIYERIAVPLIVEYLKSQMQMPGAPR